jgi:hypothetical protein
MKNNTNLSTSHWRNKMLRKLDNVSSGSGGGSGDASATNQLTANITLQGILSELQNDSGIAESVVKDSSDIVHIRRTEVNQDTGVKTTTYINPTTEAPTTPTFPLVVDGEDSKDVYTLVRVYDDNGVTNEPAFTKIFAQYKTDKDGVRTLVQYFEEDLITVYSLVGTVRMDIGEETQTNVVSYSLGDTTPNNTFTTSNLMQSVFIDVVTVADTSNPPTITTFALPGDTSTILVKPLREGRLVSMFSANKDLRLVPGIIVTANSGDIIDITYTNKISI